MKIKQLIVPLLAILIVSFTPVVSATDDKLAVDIPIIIQPIAAGSSHSLAIKSDGSLWGWGLLDDDYTYVNTSIGSPPVKILDNVISVAATYHSAAIKSDGSLWVWGRNAVGQVGDGTTDFRVQPVKVMEDVVSVALGDGSTFAVKKDGSLWGWGKLMTSAESYYVDGFEDGYHYMYREYPTKIQTTPEKIMDDVVAVGVTQDWFNVIVLKTDGTVWGWGANEYCELGNGPAKASMEPIFIMDNVKTIAASFRKCVALKNDGTIWEWGQAYNYSMYVTNDDTPRLVMEDVSFFATSGEHTLAVKTDQTLWAWGWNASGQLGIGTNLHDVNLPRTEGSREPVYVMDDVVAVSADYHSMAVKSDGSLWVWGHVLSGKLGLDTNSNTAIPHAIMNNVALPGSTFSGPPQLPPDFSNDPPSTWALNSMIRAVNLELVPETLQCQFKDNITRAEFCALAVPMIEELQDEITVRGEFNDTEDINIQKIGGLGIVDGTGNGSFSPEREITRQEAALILQRMAAVLDKPLPESTSTFTDSDTVYSWAKAAVGAVEAGGIMTGTGNDKFTPRGLYTREQSILTLLRMWDWVNS